MNRFKNVLLVSDLSPAKKNALDRAVELAQRNQADLTIIDFINDLPKALRKIQADVLKVKKKQMEETVSALRQKVSRVSCQILQGTCFVEIIRKVIRNKHDLVIIPAEGKTKFKEHIFGSTSMHLMRKCPCPVWVIKTSRSKKYFHILAAIDLSEDGSFKNHINTKIMDLSSSLANWDCSDLHMVYSWHTLGKLYLYGNLRFDIKQFDLEARNEYKRRMKLLLAEYKLNKATTKIHINKGTAIEVIPSLVKKYHIDLIVMGTVCRNGLAGALIGNTAEGVLQQVDCSVLTVKPDGFVSPVR